MSLEKSTERSVTAVASTALGLLVGRNPIPNAVAAMALGGEISEVLLFHTVGVRETYSVAKLLESFLTKRQYRGEVKTCNVASPERAADTRQALLEECKRRPSVHLSYTGGTKPMVRGAWLAAGELARKGAHIALSYLDDRANNHVLRVCELDERGKVDPATWRVSPDLRATCAFAIGDVAELHGYAATNISPAPDPFLDPFLQAFASETTSSPLPARYQFTHEATKQSFKLWCSAVGYQLWVFAGSPTDEVSEAKHLAFQTLMHASQVGGEEAEVVLATGLSNQYASDLERVLRLLHGGVRVLNKDILNKHGFGELLR